jgi:plasmid stability protein
MTDIVISDGSNLVAHWAVRHIEAEVKSRLKRRAERHGLSMEEEVRDILRNSAKGEEALAGGLGTEIASLFRKAGLAGQIPELRGEQVKLPPFE